MTPAREELLALLTEIGWSQRELGRRVIMPKSTVGRWATGRSRVPTPVLAYLRVMVRLRRIAK